MTVTWTAQENSERNGGLGRQYGYGYVMSDLSPLPGRGNLERSVVVGNRWSDADMTVVMTEESNALVGPDAIELAPLDVATADDDKADDDKVDAPTAVIRERALTALLGACVGWRERGRCIAPDGSRIAHPHPRCLAAQYQYELILLENGIRR